MVRGGLLCPSKVRPKLNATRLVRANTENLTSYVPTSDDYKKIFEYNIDAFLILQTLNGLRAILA